jgi:hypothetical protein
MYDKDRAMNEVSAYWVHFRQALREIEESPRLDYRSSLVVEIESLLAAFREDRLHPADIGELLQELSSLSKLEGKFAKELSDIGWDLRESDDWRTYEWSVGRLESLVRDLNQDMRRRRHTD